ncbi:MAG: redoxin domain-containing protein, partial [Solirubrobacterales bacterium]
MSGGGMRVVTICSAFLALACQTGWGEDQFEAQIKTVTVVDANGVPVPDAHVYAGDCLAWDNQAKTTRLTGETPWQHTDVKGTFSFEFVRRGSGSPYFVTDASFERMGSLFIARKDPNENYTVRLEKLARIKGVIRSADIAFADMRVNLYFYYAPKRTLFGLFSANYHLDAPSNEMTLDVLCPAGCDLSLRIEPNVPGIEKYQRSWDVAALQPGQVFDVGTIDLHGASGFKTFGKPAPELQVAEWVKGEPVTLAELKGKVVLLDFWGTWCGPCRRALPGLAELHRKYAGDGLVIVAVHDASRTGASLLEKNRDVLDLSNVPFRVAVDSPLEGAVVSDTAIGTGRTIAVYGIHGFPTSLIINKDGRVEDSNMTEDRIYFLLHGRHMPPATMFSRLLAGNHRLFATIIIVGSLILILAIFWGVLRLHRSR